MSNANELGVEKEKRKREIEDKLQVLNAKKHNLVKALKQVTFVLSLVLMRDRESMFCADFFFSGLFEELMNLE